ncbi:long-chain fatty acid--CoA ligase [candidate division KSB1 bacterium]|nr:long-chain fatty acid--CoA ligase [candidate division KSB1 bacterium]
MAVQTLTAMFLDVVQKHGNKTSLMKKKNGVYEGIIYNEFGERVKYVGLGLASLGIQAGDRVALISENRMEWPFSDLGILSIGATNVPIYPTITSEQIQYILADSGTKIIIASTPDLVNKITPIFDKLPQLEKVIYIDPYENPTDYMLSFNALAEKGKSFAQAHPEYYLEAASQVKPDDLCGIIYTSGTTGAPKGVMLTHQNILSNVQNSLLSLRVDETDTFLSFLPLCHSFERMAGQFLAIYAGATIAYAESVETVADNLGEVKPTLVTTVPRLLEKVYGRVIENAESGSPIKKKIFYWAVNVGEKHAKAILSGKTPAGFLKFKYGLATKLVFSKLHQRVGGHLRFFVSGGAPLSKEIAEFFFKAGILVLEGYGLTETSPVIAVNQEEKYKFGSVGPKIKNTEVRIAEDGEILTRGPNIMKGYYNNPEATDEAIDADGWLHTGDIGYLDDEGFLFITDRKKNILVTSGGKNVTPASIENLLIMSPYIDQVMVIGDKRNFLSALIVPAKDNLIKYANEQSITYESIDALLAHETINKLIKDEIDKLTANLARFEQIKKFTLLSNEFTIESGELTPSLKVKRKIVENNYASVIDAMYDGDKD